MFLRKSSLIHVHIPQALKPLRFGIFSCQTFECPPSLVQTTKMLSVTTHRDKEIVNHRADMVPNQGSCITESGRSLDQSELVCAIGEDKTASSSLGFVTSNFDSLELSPLSSGRLECSVVERGLIWRSRMAAGRALGAEALYVCTVLLLDYSASCRFAEYLFYWSVSTRKFRFNCSMLMCCLVRSYNSLN